MTETNTHERASWLTCRTPGGNRGSRVCEGCGFYLVWLRQLRSSENQWKGGRKQGRGNKQMLGELCALAIASCKPRSMKTRFGWLPSCVSLLACPSCLSHLSFASLSWGLGLKCLTHAEFSDFFLPWETPPASRGPQSLKETARRLPTHFCWLSSPSY